MRQSILSHDCAKEGILFEVRAKELACLQKMCNSHFLKGGVSMKISGVILSALGLVILALSFASDAAPEGTYNIGPLQHQMMMFSLGGLLVLVGAVVGSVGYALDRMVA